MTEKKVLLGVTGSVAAINSWAIAEMLRGKGIDVKVVMTRTASTNFNTSPADSPIPILRDEDEFSTWHHKGDPVLHIEVSFTQLRKWADLLLIAPLSANTLAKMANGLCDNLLTCIVRAWDVAKPMVVAPAMNTMMWSNPFTERHLSEIRGVYHATVVDVVSKQLACGDVGFGAMAAPATIVSTTLSLLGLPE